MSKLSIEEIDGVKPIQTFQELPVFDWIKSAIGQLRLKTPTRIQQYSIPAALSGRNVIGASSTGSGKTLCFAIPILQSLAKEPQGGHSLILTPTRELAFQIGDQFKLIGASMNVRVEVVVGGIDSDPQACNLSQMPHIIISTPGRFEHLVKSTTLLNFTLKRAKFLVLDEADKLLTPRFQDSLAYILPLLPPVTARQTLLFSATMTKNLERLGAAFQGLKKPFSFDATENNEVYALPKTLTQEYILVPPVMQECYLVFLLSQFRDISVIVFVSDKSICETIHVLLKDLGMSVVHIHSMMKQSERLEAIHLLKSGLIKILVATDVASRGLDIPCVGLVVNYSLPEDCPNYIHRVGRTARAGRSGRAISIITQYDVEHVLEVESATQTKMVEYPHDHDDVMAFLNKTLAAKQVAMLHLDENGFFEKVERYKQVAQEQREEAKAAKKGESGEKEKKKKKNRNKLEGELQGLEVGDGDSLASNDDQRALTSKKSKKKKKRNLAEVRAVESNVPDKKRKRESIGLSAEVRSDSTGEKKKKVQLSHTGAIVAEKASPGKNRPNSLTKHSSLEQRHSKKTNTNF